MIFNVHFQGNMMRPHDQTLCLSHTRVKIGPSSLFVIEEDRKIISKGWATGLWTSEHPEPLSDKFQSRGSCTSCLVGGNLSPNTCGLTQADCSHSQTNWWRSVNSCHLISKHVATNQSQSVQLVCDVSRDAKRSQTNSRQTLSNCYFIAVVKHQLQLTAKGRRHALRL